MRYGILTAALALGGACVLGTAVLVTADDGDPGAAPTATYKSAPKEKNVKPVAKDSDKAKAATKQSKDALAGAGLAIPEGWHPAQIRDERHEDRPVTVVRYEKDTTRDLGGEHITTVVDAEGTLYGYTRMTVAGQEARTGRRQGGEDGLRLAARLRSRPRGRPVGPVGGPTRRRGTRQGAPCTRSPRQGEDPPRQRPLAHLAAAPGTPSEHDAGPFSANGGVRCYT
ncbi:hypothetical protein [Streptomyces sp. ISL-100]|uniref:hypothetical protein n=1 Tax=Streptomyces sp. ISL-100 TaxID=2819173 RepID=UPI001BEBE7B4|nr:hypothetical protein [Streptomyces sp. ISL-100]MBT2396437.1 hypothetical protein [Streptomyces sp. ISL-100]